MWLALGLAVVAIVLFRSASAGGAARPFPSSGGSLNPRVKSEVERWRRDAEAVSFRPGLYTALVLAVIARESGGDAGAVGDAGASYGLMQIQRATWQDYQTATADPDTVLWPDSMEVGELNIRVGAWTLADRIDRMGGEFDGLRAYNAGVWGATRNPTAGADYAAWIQEKGVPAFRNVT